MTKRNRESLRQFFLTGKTPTEGQFADLIDSALNQLDDSVTSDQNGRVGIGASAPSANLTVRGRLFTPLKGTISLATGSADLFGDGTSFDSELAAGDVIRVGQEVLTVGLIKNATHAVLALPAVSAADAANAYRDVSLLLIENGKGDVQLVVDKSGNVGVGVASPGAKLHVKGSLLATELAGSGSGLTNLKASNIEGTLAPAQLPALTVAQMPNLPASKITEGQLDPQRIPTLDASKITGQLRPEQIPGMPTSDWMTELKKYLSVTPAGRLGIGVPQPHTDLHISRHVPRGLGPVLTLMNTGGGPGSGAALDFDGWPVPPGVAPAARIQSIDDNGFSSHLVFYTKNPGGATNPLAERMRIESNGNVGIGAPPPPDVKLFVAGPLRAPQLQGDGRNVTHLKASNVEGTLAVAQIPDLPASKVAGLLPGVWAEEIVVYAQGLKLSARPRAKGGVGGFFIGLLQLGDPNESPAYALGIAFEQRLLSFDSAELSALEKGSGDFKLNIYTERTRMPSRAQFVGVAPALAFDLRTPEAQLAAPSRGKVRSLVVLRPTRPAAVAEAATLLCRSASPFSFNAVVNPASTQPPTQKELAQQLAAEKLLAHEAAPLLIAHSPQAASVVSNNQRPDGDHFDSVVQFIDFMGANFDSHGGSPAHMAWMLGASGIPADNACAALGQFLQSISPQDFLEATLGAFPGPAVRAAVIKLQTVGASAQDAAPQLKALNPVFDKHPLQLGILLRINFHDTADTPLALARAWKKAGYALTDDLTPRLKMLFPLTETAEVDAALREAYRS